MRQRDIVNATERERIGKLETAMDGIRFEFTEVKSTLLEIQKSLSRSQRTDWQTIFAGLIVVGALYASAIRPIESNVARTDSAATKLAEAVIVQNDKINNLAVEQRMIDAKLERAIKDIAEVQSNGSVAADKRISILETQMKGK